MKNNKTECPACIGVGEVMEGKKKTKGFEYKTCNLCNGNKVVSQELADDYVFAKNEDNFETNDDW